MKNYVKPLQKALVFLLSTVLLFSCSQIETFEGPDLSEAQARIPVQFKTTDFNARVGAGFVACGTPLTSKLLAGQHIPVGEVTVFNDNEKFYVTVSIDKGDGFDEGDWFIQKIHGYFGSVEVDFLADPKGKQKKGIINPAPGKFPISESISLDYSVADQEFTYELAIEDYLKEMGEFDVAIHAEVVRVENIREEEGVLVADIVQSESAWGEGQRFNQGTQGNWSMYMSYTVQECAQDVCNPNWNRKVNVTSNDEYNDPENELEVTYQINDVDQGRIGEVVINRGGSKNAAKGFTFTMTFIPDDGVDFKTMEVCISATESGTETCSSTTTLDVNGNYVITIENAPYTSTGGKPQAASSWVKVSVESDKCD